VRGAAADTLPGARAAPLLNPESGEEPLERTGWRLPRKSGASHYMYENTRTYRKFEEIALNCMYLKIKELQ